MCGWFWFKSFAKTFFLCCAAKSLLRKPKLKHENSTQRNEIVGHREKLMNEAEQKKIREGVKRHFQSVLLCFWMEMGKRKSICTEIVFPRSVSQP